MFYCRVLWTDRIIERYTNVSIKISHMNIIHISDTSTNGPRIIVCYFHFQIHTAHTETFHKRGSECPSYAVKHYFPLLVRDSRTRKQSLLWHMFVWRLFLCVGPQNTNIRYGCLFRNTLLCWVYACIIRMYIYIYIYICLYICSCVRI